MELAYGGLVLALWAYSLLQVADEVRLVAGRGRGMDVTVAELQQRCPIHRPNLHRRLVEIAAEWYRDRRPPDERELRGIANEIASEEKGDGAARR